MSADFWAGYISGAAGILIGNPLDLIKVRLQASPTQSAVLPADGRPPTPRPSRNPFTTASSLVRGSAAPILGYGGLNALLFMTYNRSLSYLSSSSSKSDLALSPVAWEPTLSATFVAGGLGGLATWFISTPTELVKCRAQVQGTAGAATEPPIQSSYGIAKQIYRAEGVKGLYFGGTVTALRDSIGYGFYFWSYEIMTRWMRTMDLSKDQGSWSESGQEAAKVLLCGGIAGVVTWLSVFPLDVIKTRIQTQAMASSGSPEVTGGVGAQSPLLGNQTLPERRLKAWEMTKRTYRNEGVSVFFRGLGVCSLRAFIVNAAQWAVYEWIMNELEPGRRRIQIDTGTTAVL